MEEPDSACRTFITYCHGWPQPRRLRETPLISTTQTGVSAGVLDQSPVR